jgi:hypothetical protein
LSSLPDISKAPSNEKVREFVKPAWPERTDVWVPVIASRITMLPDFKPTAMVSFRHVRVCGR